MEGRHRRCVCELKYRFGTNVRMCQNSFGGQVGDKRCSKPLSNLDGLTQFKEPFICMVVVVFVCGSANKDEKILLFRVSGMLDFKVRTRISEGSDFRRTF